MFAYSLPDGYSIEIFAEHVHTIGSADNVNRYDRYYYCDEGHPYGSTGLGVKLYRDDELKKSCMLVGPGDVYDKSTLVDGHQLVICCGECIFALSIPNLELNWKTSLNCSYCFSIHKWQDDYIIYGETKISRLDKNGHTTWSFAGADIFVSIDGKDPFVMCADHIALIDFEGRTYKIGYDGQVIKV